MTLLRTLLTQAFRKAAGDPEVRAKAGDFTRREVAPRLSAARDELKDLAAEAGSKDGPREFMRLLGRRVAKVNRHHSKKS